MGKIRQNDEVYKQMLAALQKNDLKGVEDLIANNNFKSGFGSAVLKFSKIPYSSSNDLVKKVLQYRRNLGTGKGTNAGSGSNIAVFEYLDKSGKITYKIEMAISGLKSTMGHAEQVIARKLDNAGISPENVKRIYSELDTCGACTDGLKNIIRQGQKDITLLNIILREYSFGKTKSMIYINIFWVLKSKK